MTIEVGKPMPYFCPACQAIPQAGYCNLAGCPTAPGETPAPAAPDLLSVALGTDAAMLRRFPSGPDGHPATLDARDREQWLLTRAAIANALGQDDTARSPKKSRKTP